MNKHQKRGEHEITHGKKLAQNNPELIWGWGTPAGRLRAHRRAEWITKSAELGPDKHVLEIGCGTGLFTELFARSGAHIVAVDISGDLLELARKKNLPTDKVEFLQKRFEECDLDGRFDAVIGSSILHHLDIQPALTRIKELLKPGGIMSFGEPNMLNPMVMILNQISAIRRAAGFSPDEMAFTRWGIKQHLEEAGFTGIKVIPRDWLYPSTPPALIKMVQTIERPLEQIPLLREIAGSIYIRAVA